MTVQGGEHRPRHHSAAAPSAASRDRGRAESPRSLAEMGAPVRPAPAAPGQAATRPSARLLHSFAELIEATQAPGCPAAPSGFSRKLLDHGIDARPTRNAALIAFLEDVAHPILADTLGLHINTVVRWADIARRDWTTYLAARDGEPRSPGGTKGTSKGRIGHAGTSTRQGGP